MFCNQNAYAPKSLDYKGLQPRRIHTQTGSTSRKTISKHSILRPYFDYDFSDAHSNKIAQDFERYIKETRKYKKETPIFVEDILNKILYLHKYNLKVSEVTLKYPLSRNFTQLLLHYVALECIVLYRREYYSPRNEITVEKRILRLLLTIYNSYYETLMNLPPKKLFQESAKAVLTLLIRIKPEFDIQNKLIENIVIKLLRKLGELEKITALKGKCIPCPLDTYLSDPTLLNTYKNIIITSDYGTDDDLKIEDEEVQVETEEERNNDSVDVKLEIDDLLRISNRLNQRQFGKPSTKLPTVYIDDNDEHMISWEEEIKTSDKSCKRKEENKERELIRRKKQNQAFFNHKPIKTDLPYEIKTDVKDEVIDLDINSEDELSTSTSLTYTSNSHSIHTTHNAIISDEVVIIGDNSDEASKPVSFKTNNSRNITHVKGQEILDLSSSDEDAICDKITKEREDELLGYEDEVFIVEVPEPFNKCAVNQQSRNEPLKMQVQEDESTKNVLGALVKSTNVNKFNEMLKNDEIYSYNALPYKIIAIEAQSNYATTTTTVVADKTLPSCEPDSCVLEAHSIREEYLIYQNECTDLTDFESYYVLEACRAKESQNMQNEIIRDGRDTSKIISESVSENKIIEHTSKSATENESSNTEIINTLHNKLDLYDKENKKAIISHDAGNRSLIKVKTFANIVREIESDNEDWKIVHKYNKIDVEQNKSDEMLIERNKEKTNTVLTKQQTFFMEDNIVDLCERNLSEDLHKSVEEMSEKILLEVCPTVTIDNIKTCNFDSKISEVTETKKTEQVEDNIKDNEEVSVGQFSIASNNQEVTVEVSTINNNTKMSAGEIDETVKATIEENNEEEESIVSSDISEQSSIAEEFTKELTKQVNSDCMGSSSKEQYSEVVQNFSRNEIICLSSDNPDLITAKNYSTIEASVLTLTDEHERSCLEKENKVTNETENNKQTPMSPIDSKQKLDTNEKSSCMLSEEVLRCKVTEDEDLAEGFVSTRPEALETTDLDEEQVTNEDKLKCIATYNEEYNIEKVANQIVISTMEEKDLDQTDPLTETSGSDKPASAFDKTDQIDKYLRDSNISEEEYIEEPQRNIKKNQELYTKTTGVLGGIEETLNVNEENKTEKPAEEICRTSEKELASDHQTVASVETTVEPDDIADTGFISQFDSIMKLSEPIELDISSKIMFKDNVKGVKHTQKIEEIPGFSNTAAEKTVEQNEYFITETSFEANDTQVVNLEWKNIPELSIVKETVNYLYDVEVIESCEVEITEEDTEQVGSLELEKNGYDIELNKESNESSDIYFERDVVGIKEKDSDMPEKLITLTNLIPPTVDEKIEDTSSTEHVFQKISEQPVDDSDIHCNKTTEPQTEKENFFQEPATEINLNVATVDDSTKEELSLKNMCLETLEQSANDSEINLSRIATKEHIKVSNENCEVFDAQISKKNSDTIHTLVSDYFKKDMEEFKEKHSFSSSQIATEENLEVSDEKKINSEILDTQMSKENGNTTLVSETIEPGEDNCSEKRQMHQDAECTKHLELPETGRLNLELNLPIEGIDLQTTEHSDVLEKPLKLTNAHSGLKSHSDNGCSQNNVPECLDKSYSTVPVTEINLNDVTVNDSSKEELSFENVYTETLEQPTNDSESDYLEKEFKEIIPSTEISSNQIATKKRPEVSSGSKINSEEFDGEISKQNLNEIEQFKENKLFNEINSSQTATEESPKISYRKKINSEVLDTQMSKENSNTTVVSEVIKPLEGNCSEKRKMHPDAECTEHLNVSENNQLNQGELNPAVEEIDLKTGEHLDVLEKSLELTDAYSGLDDHIDNSGSQNSVYKHLDRSCSSAYETHNQEMNCNKQKPSGTINLEDQIHDDLKDVEYVNDLNIQKEEVTGDVGTLESHISEETVMMDGGKSVIHFNTYDKVILKEIAEDDLTLHNQIVSQIASSTDISLDASDSLLKRIDALKKIGTEILVASNSQQLVSVVVQDLDISKIPNENTSLDILATVASKVSRQDLLRSKSNKKSTRRGRKKQTPLKIKSVPEETKIHKKRTKNFPVTVDPENKRITRSSHMRTSQEQKCKPHDFLVNNSKILPPANNIYTHKLSEVNLTSEDSNDSEGNLFIDEEIDLKGSKPKDTFEENSAIERNIAVAEKLTHYDEDTLEEEVTCPCEPKVKGTVLISIPDNYQDNFEILKQIEEMDQGSSKNLDVFTEESTKHQVDVVQVNGDGAVFNRDFGATGEIFNHLNNNVSENVAEVIKIPDNSCKEVECTVDSPDSHDLNEQNPKPFRTMAERKDYNKFELNPYVSIERLNIYSLKEKGEQETEYKKTRSKSFDIGIIRRKVLNVGETDQLIHFKNDASSQSSVIESKTATGENSYEASKLHKELNKVTLTGCSKNQYTEDNLEDKADGRNDSGNTDSSDLDDIPLLQRAQNNNKRRYGPRIVVKKKKEKIGRKINVNENQPKHESSGKIKKKQIKVTKKEAITKPNDDTNYITTKLRRKSLTYEKPKDINTSCIPSLSQDKISKDSSNTDVSTDLGTNSENFALDKKHDLKDNKNNASISKIEMESKENEFIKSDNEALNKSSKKTTKEISEEEMVKCSNKKYYTTPKLRRKSVSKDTLNIMKQVVLDTKRLGDIAKSGIPSSEKLTFSPDKKYYTPPKLRMKPMIENANIKNMIAKKTELTELKPTTEIDILLRCKNTVSTTTEKLKKKLEIDFKLKHKDILLEDTTPISNKSDQDNSMLVNAPQIGYNDSDLPEEKYVISNTEEARKNDHGNVHSLVTIENQSVEVENSVPKYDILTSTSYDQRISEELDIRVEKEACVTDQNEEVDVQLEKVNIHVETEVCVTNQNEETDEHSEKVDIHVEKEVCVSDKNEDIDQHSEKVDIHVEKEVCVSDQNEEIDEHSEKGNIHVEKEVCVSGLNEEIDEHLEKVDIHVEKEVCVCDPNEEIDVHLEKENIHVETEVCVTDQNEEIDEHSEKEDIHVEKEVCVSDKNEDIDQHSEKVDIHVEKEVCVSDQNEEIDEHSEKVNIHVEKEVCVSGLNEEIDEHSEKVDIHVEKEVCVCDQNEEIDEHSEKMDIHVEKGVCVCDQNEEIDEHLEKNNERTELIQTAAKLQEDKYLKQNSIVLETVPQLIHVEETEKLQEKPLSDKTPLDTNVPSENLVNTCHNQECGIAMECKGKPENVENYSSEQDIKTREIEISKFPIPLVVENQAKGTSKQSGTEQIVNEPNHIKEGEASSIVQINVNNFSFELKSQENLILEDKKSAQIDQIVSPSDVDTNVSSKGSVEKNEDSSDDSDNIPLLERSLKWKKSQQHIKLEKTVDSSKKVKKSSSLTEFKMKAENKRQGRKNRSKSDADTENIKTLQEESTSKVFLSDNINYIKMKKMNPIKNQEKFKENMENILNVDSHIKTDIINDKATDFKNTDEDFTKESKNKLNNNNKSTNQLFSNEEKNKGTDRVKAINKTSKIILNKKSASKCQVNENVLNENELEKSKQEDCSQLELNETLEKGKMKSDIKKTRKEDKVPSKETDKDTLKILSTQSYSTCISSTVKQDCDELNASTLKSGVQVTNKSDRKNNLIKLATESVSSSQTKSEKQDDRRECNKKQFGQSKSGAANKKDGNKLESRSSSVSSTSSRHAHGHDLKRDRHKSKSRSGSVSSDSFSSKSEVEELSKSSRKYTSTKHKSKSKSSSSSSSVADVSDLLKDERKNYDHKTAKHKNERHSSSKNYSRSTQSSAVSSTTTPDIPKKSKKDNDNTSVKSRSTSVNPEKSYRSLSNSDRKTDFCRRDTYLERNTTSSEEKTKKDNKSKKEQTRKKKESRNYKKHRHISPSKIKTVEVVEIEIAENTEPNGSCDEKQAGSENLQKEDKSEISGTKDTLDITMDNILTTVPVSDVEEMKSTNKATKDNVQTVNLKEASMCDKNTEPKNNDSNMEIEKETSRLIDIPPMEVANINLKTGTGILEDKFQTSSVGEDTAKEPLPNVVELSCGDLDNAKRENNKIFAKNNIRLDEKSEVDKKDELAFEITEEKSSDVEYIKIEKDKTNKNNITHNTESEMVNERNKEVVKCSEPIQKTKGTVDSNVTPNKSVNAEAEVQARTADIIAKGKTNNVCQIHESREKLVTSAGDEKISNLSTDQVLQDKKVPEIFQEIVEQNNVSVLGEKEKSTSEDSCRESSTKNETNGMDNSTALRPPTDLLDIQEGGECVEECRQSTVANSSFTGTDYLTNGIANPKIKKVYNADSTQVRLRNIQDAFEKYLPTKSKENKQSEEKTNKLNLTTKKEVKTDCKLTSTSENSLVYEIEGELNIRKRKAVILEADSSSGENIASALDASNKKAKLEEITIDISSNDTRKQLSPSSTSPKKKERKSIEFIISHLMEEKTSNSLSREEISKPEISLSSKVDNLDVKMLKKKLLLKIKKFSSDQIAKSSKTVTNVVNQTVTESMEKTNSLPSISEGLENKYEVKKSESVKNNDHHFETDISLDKTETSTDTITNNDTDVSKGLIVPAGETAEFEHGKTKNKSDNNISPSSEIISESSNSFISNDTPISENIQSVVATTPGDIVCDKTEMPEATRAADTVITAALPTEIEKHGVTKLEEHSCQQTLMNNVIETLFVDDSLNISSVESIEIESPNRCAEDFSSTSAEDANILNLSDLIMHVDAEQTNITNMGEITVLPEDVCMLSDIISTTIASAENKLPCVSSSGHIKLFTFPVSSQANIKDQFMSLKDVAANKNILDQTTTSAEKLVSHSDKDCVFSFNEHICNSRSQTLTSATLPLNLQDVSFSKIPMGSTQTLDLISPKTLTVVPASSGRNFMNQVPVASEVSDMSTEITGFDEADDHNYTLGGPLLNGRPEKKNILSSSFNKSLDDSPDEFPLNDNPLPELSEFADNNLREIITDDTYKLNLDNEYAVKAVVMLGGQTSSDPNVFPLSTYNLADIEKMNLIDCSVSNSEDNSNSKEFLESPNIEHEVKSTTSDVNTWREFLANENCNKKVVVLTNEQCITPSFSISHSDLIQSFSDHIVETTAPITTTINEICSPLKISEEILEVNPGIELCLVQKILELETSKETHDINVSKTSLQRSNKNIINKSAQKDSPENDFLPKRRYGRTVLRAPPKKKAPPTPPTIETKKEEVIENTNIVHDEVSSIVLANESPSPTSTNTRLLLTEQSIAVGDAPPMVLSEVLQSDLPKNSVDYAASNNTKNKPRTDLTVPERESKKKSPQYHLQSARSPLLDLLEKKSTSARQNQMPSSMLSKSPVGQIFDKKLPQKQPDSNINSRDSAERTSSENMNNQLKVSEKKLEIQSNIADLVKSRKRAATNKYSNNYSMPSITMAKKIPIKTTDMVKSKLTSPLPENVLNNTITEMRLKPDLIQPDQEHKKYSPRSYNRGHKSPATLPLVTPEDKRKSAYQNYSDIQKKGGDTINIGNSSKEFSNFCETLGNKRSSSQSSIPAEACKKPVDRKYNYSIDSILSKDFKSCSNYMYENPVKDYTLTKNRGMKRSTTTTEEEEKEMGRVDKKQVKVHTNSPQQSKDTFDKLREQGNINKNICLRVTEDNKLKTERRNSPQIKYYVKERNEKDHHQSRSSFHPVYDRTRVSSRQEEERRSISKSRSYSSYQPPYTPTRHKTKEGYLIDYNKGREGYYSDHIRGREGYHFSHRREGHQSDHVRGMGGPHHSSVSVHPANRIQANTSRSSNVSEPYYRNASGLANPTFHPTTSQISGSYLKRNAILSPEKQTELLNSLKDKVLDQLNSIDRGKNEDEGAFTWIDKLNQRIDTNILGPSTASVPQFIPEKSSPRNDRK